jgi:amicyanin
MKNSLLITIIVIVVIVIAVIVGFIVMKYPMTTLTNPTPNPNPSPSQSPTGTTYNIAISGFSFSPASLSIKAGDTVIWTNQDSVPHTVTSDSGSELNSPTFGKGKTYSHTFTTTGTYNYHCTIHPNMKATIIVA